MFASPDMAARVLGEVNEAAGGSWELEAPLAGGAQQGAWRVRCRSGPAVLKWRDAHDEVYNPDAPTVVEYLRAAGYPVPAWLAFGSLGDGGSWSIQEFIDGQPMRELADATADIFIGLVSIQQTLSLPTDLTWNPYIRGRCRMGSPVYDALVDAGGELADLVAAGAELASPYQDTELPDGGMVHSDLSVSNLLMRDGRLVGVVDVEAAGRGCAAYDLMSAVMNGLIWSSSPSAIERLVDFGIGAFAPGEVAVATACQVVDIVDWYVKAAPDLLCRRIPDMRAWLTHLRSRMT